MAYDNTNKGSLWFKNDRNNQRYQNGVINVEGKEFWISIFLNTKKQQGSNQPDFNVVLNPKEKKG